MNLKKLGNLIRERRVELGISPTILARKAEIARSTLYLLERGENPRTGEPSRPSRHIVLNLAAALHLNEDDLRVMLELAGYGPITSETRGGSSTTKYTAPVRSKRNGQQSRTPRRLHGLALQAYSLPEEPRNPKDTSTRENTESTKDQLPRGTVGYQIDELLEAQDLSVEEKNKFSETLVAITQQLLTLLKSN